MLIHLSLVKYNKIYVHCLIEYNHACFFFEHLYTTKTHTMIDLMLILLLFFILNQSYEEKVENVINAH